MSLNADTGGRGTEVDLAKSIEKRLNGRSEVGIHCDGDGARRRRFDAVPEDAVDGVNLGSAASDVGEDDPSLVRERLFLLWGEAFPEGTVGAVSAVAVAIVGDEGFTLLGSAAAADVDSFGELVEAAEGVI